MCGFTLFKFELFKLYSNMNIQKKYVIQIVQIIHYTNLNI